MNRICPEINHIPAFNFYHQYLNNEKLSTVHDVMMLLVKWITIHEALSRLYF